MALPGRPRRLRGGDGAGADKIAPQDDGDQDLGGVAEYDDGAWRVVFKRPLTTGSAKGDVQFEPGRYIPFVVMAWDGGAGESGLRQSLSSWYNLTLEAPISGRVYARAGAGVLLVALLELFLLWKAGALGAGKPPADPSRRNGRHQARQE